MADAAPQGDARDSIRRDPRTRLIERMSIQAVIGVLLALAVSAVLAVSERGGGWGAILGTVVCALLAGALLGFLFGIPRSLATVSANGAAAGGSGARSGFSHNTNLEQISDWLTKIVVGIGLVEARNIAEGFSQLSADVALAWGLKDGAPTAGCMMLGAALIGFLGFYIWTRTAFVYYLEYNETAVSAERRDREAAERRASQAEDAAANARQQAEQAERDAEAERQRKDEAERQAQEARAQAEAAARQAEEAARQTQEAEKQTQEAQRSSDLYSRMAGYLDSGLVEPLRVMDFVKKMEGAVTGPGPEHAEAEEQDVWDSDPNLGRFGGAAIARDRELGAQVQALDETGATCAVTLRVRSLDPARPLTGTVRIHLHPTFQPDLREVAVVDGVAELRIVAGGAFTVGAEADDGATRLELNLAELPGVPALFASR